MRAGSGGGRAPRAVPRPEPRASGYNSCVQLSAEQLPAHLKRGLAPLYFLSGDEPLGAQECADAIRAAAAAAGHGERKVYTVESGFDWDAFYADLRERSLFAERRLIELRLPSGKPGEQGARVLAEIAADPAPDVVLLVTTGKLDKQARAAKWVAALERAGVAIALYPVDARQLPGWIERRMRARGLVPDPEVVQMLAYYTEGNLLACAQEIEKLAMRGLTAVTTDDIAGDLGDNARFTVYALADAALAGDARAALRILRVLAAEGESPVLTLWALAREVRDLARMAQAVAGGRGIAQVLDDFRVWPRRRPLMQKALARLSVPACHDLVLAAARADRVAKGRGAGDVWLELENLVLALSGRPGTLPNASREYA